MKACSGFLLLFATFSQGFKFFDNSRSDFKEYVSPKLTSEHHLYKRSDIFEYPIYLTASFIISGFDIFLNSTRKDNIDTNIPGTIRSKDGIVRTQNPEKPQSAVYQDSDQGASFLLSCEEDLANCKIIGTFHIEGRQYTIQPAVPNDEESERHSHVVNRVPPYPDNSHPLDFPKFPYGSNGRAIQDLAKSVYNNVDDKTQSSNIHKRSVPGRYVAELYFVADYTMYEFFLSDFGGETSAALTNMLLYFKSIISEMDLRFKQMNKTVPGLNFDVVLIGYDIAVDRESSSWSSTNEFINGGETILEANLARNSFDKFLNSDTDIKALNPDGILAFTRHKLLINTGRGYKQTGGNGWPSICIFPYNFQIISDPFDGGIGRQAAHYTGLLMFMKTDSNTPSCPENDEDLYIMSGIPGDTLPGPSKRTHPWTWSTCLNAFATVVPSFECLKDNRFSASVTMYTINSGQVFDIEQQCQLVYGANSSNCTDTREDICYNGIDCFNPATGSCSKIVAKDRTSCGEGRWCYLGTCTEVPSTVSVSTASPGAHTTISRSLILPDNATGTSTLQILETTTSNTRVQEHSTEPAISSSVPPPTAPSPPPTTSPLPPATSTSLAPHVTDLPTTSTFKRQCRFYRRVTYAEKHRSKIGMKGYF